MSCRKSAELMFRLLELVPVAPVPLLPEPEPTGGIDDDMRFL
jgi:hypothetical protein